MTIPFYAMAESESFAYSSKWLSLVHYQKTLTGYKATIGSEDFYLSQEGRTNPLTELKATIELFNHGDDEIKCRFPARYKLLYQEKLISSKFPKCKEYEQFVEDLQPKGVTLIFTDAYMNNSSSLFGHTLLRVDTKRKGTQLLAHGINYGAYTNGYENSFLYAIYGLAGFYPAGFTTKPYYDVINTYNNLENRDIWEYNLDFTDDKLEFFVAHVWEVGQTTTPYYFFTLNCSYMLMEVFDAVRPELKLAQDFRFYTIPLDTLKKVSSKEGLVKSVTYRPSRQRKINHKISQMSKAQYQSFLKAVKEDDYDLSQLPQEQRADVLETAYQYIQYQYVAGDLELEEYRKKSFKALKARNQAPDGQTFNDLKTGKDPVYSHDSARISLSTGLYDKHAFEQLDFRFAYHGLIDRPHGFLQGAEINFMDLKFRHYEKNDNYVLQNAQLLSLASLSPISDVFMAPSYKISLGIERQDLLKSHTSGYTFNGSVSGGGSFENNKTLFYALSSLDGAYGGFLRNNQWLGFGLAAGMLINAQTISFQAEAKKIFATDKIGSTCILKAQLDYYLTRNLALETSYKRTINDDKNFDEFLIGLNKYF